MNASGQRVCLNMIVRNEAPVIRRCLASVMPIIDSWVIVDTGSDDGTQQIVRETLANLPGELHERPWVNFAHNRSEALKLARPFGDYTFVIDADEVLDIEPGFTLPSLAVDSCNLQVRYSGIVYLRRQLVRSALPWRYEGVLHEYVTCEQARTERFLPGLATVAHHDGARARDPQTYRKDIEILEHALKEDPSNTRYTFYLAQSYRDAGMTDEAIRAYVRRVELGGWIEEVWYSQYQIAQLRHQLQHPWPEVLESYLAAWQTQPLRAGPLYRVAMHYQAKAEYATSHLFLQRAMRVPKPGPDSLFVEVPIYDYQIAVDYAVASFYVGDHEAAIATNNSLLSSGKLPSFAVDQVICNRRYSLEAHYQRVRGGSSGAHSLCAYIVLDTAEPGPAFDDCLDSLLQQQGEPLQVVVLAPAIPHELQARTALSDHFALQTAMCTAPLSAIAQNLQQRFAVPDLVLHLSPELRLENETSLQSLRALFEDSNCSLAFGQLRDVDGRLCNSEPPASALSLDALGTDITRNSPVLFRSRLLLCEPAAQPPLSPQALLQRAGYNGIRFSDEIVAAKADAAKEEVCTAAQTPVRLPKITCMMVTLDRLALAKHSILLFARQTYPNRELLIVTDGTAAFAAALERYSAALGLDNVRLLHLQGPRQTLGTLRNLAVQEASGDIVCQWDDDDGNHPERLMVQAQHLLQNNAGASFLTDHLQLIADKRALCWIDWTAGSDKIGPDNLFPGSLMMHRTTRVHYPETGPLSRRGEDSALLYDLHRHSDVKPLQGKGYLYLYLYHGRNTFSREHHYNLSQFRYPKDVLHQQYDRLRDAARYYALPEPCYVLAREGRAFVLER